jgi:uncharacterized membrane protein
MEAAESVAKGEPGRSDEAPAARYSLERLVFLSDAVFAIAMTLLALDVRLPAGLELGTNEALVSALGDIGPQILAYVISFVVIGAFWMGHYRTFRVLTAADGRLMWLNLAFLLCIALLPFPTSVVAAHGDLAAAVILYATFAGITGLLSALVWVYAASVAHLARPTVTPQLARHITYMALTVPALFLASIPIALANPLLAEVSWGLAGPVQLAVTRRFGLGRALDPASASRAAADAGSTAPSTPPAL